MWLGRAGERVPVARPDHPYALQLAGRWQDAVKAWEDAGYPYERAAALAESPAPADQLAAVAELDLLGAVPLAHRIRRRLRAEGTRVPRGPAAATREHPAGLTERQQEVLALLAEGLTNAEIADRLVLSVRTAANHVAAVLEKLGVHSREEAVARSRDLGIDPANSE
jgi:DNA-binding NarL/FixJ family response regulator